MKPGCQRLSIADDFRTLLSLSGSQSCSDWVVTLLFSLGIARVDEEAWLTAASFTSAFKHGLQMEASQSVAIQKVWGSALKMSDTKGW
jgi:hypothetical protein